MKKRIILAAILILVLSLGGWYKFIKLQPAEHRQLTQIELQEMERCGTVLKITDNKLIVDVDDSNKKKSGTHKYKIDEYTVLQIGVKLVNQPGEKINLQRYIKEGDNINFLVDGKRVVLIKEG